MSDRVVDITRSRGAWLEQMVMPHEARVRASLTRRNLCPDIVDDIIHDSYLRLLNTPSVEHIENVAGYFLRTAMSVMISRLRHLRCVPTIPLPDNLDETLESEEPGQDRILAAREELSQVASVMKELPGRRGETLRLRRIEALSVKHTAALLGVSTASVEKDLRFAAEYLRSNRILAEI